MPYKDRSARLEYAKAYHLANRDRLLQDKRKYSKDHAAQVRAGWATWVAANPDRRAAIEKRARQRYAETHPDHIRDKVARRRARVLAVSVDMVRRETVLAMGNGVCGICREAVDPSRWEVDHIVPLSRGGPHSYANTQPSHPACNRRKSARLQGNQLGMGLAG